MKNFPVMLRTLRKQAKMTQPDLAERLGISRSAVSMYESGSREPNFAMLRQIAEIFDVDMNTLSGEPMTEHHVTARDIKFALFGSADVDDDLYEEVKAFAQFAQSRRK